MFNYFKKNWIAICTLLIAVIGSIYAYRGYESSKPLIKIDIQYEPLKVSRFEAVKGYLKNNKEEYEKFLAEHGLPRDDEFIHKYLYLVYKYFKYRFFLNFIANDSEITSSISEQNTYYLTQKYKKLERELDLYVFGFDIVLPINFTVLNNGGTKTSLTYKKLIIKGFGIDDDEPLNEEKINIEVDAGSNKSFNHTITHSAFFRVFFTTGFMPVMFSLLDDVFNFDEDEDDEFFHWMFPQLREKLMFDLIPVLSHK